MVLRILQIKTNFEFGIFGQSIAQLCATARETNSTTLQIRSSWSCMVISCERLQLLQWSTLLSPQSDRGWAYWIYVVVTAVAVAHFELECSVFAHRIKLFYRRISNDVRLLMLMQRIKNIHVNLQLIRTNKGPSLVQWPRALISLHWNSRPGRKTKLASSLPVLTFQTTTLDRTTFRWSGTLYPNMATQTQALILALCLDGSKF